MKGDNAEHVDAFFLLSLQARARSGGVFGGVECGLVLKAHISRHLAEDARRLNRWLRIHKNAPATEHVLVQRE